MTQAFGSTAMGAAAGMQTAEPSVGSQPTAAPGEVNLAQEVPVKENVESVGAKFCSNCGHPATGKFCSNCGSEIK